MIEKLIRFSKINQLLIVVCIFFPFFYTGCSDAELVEESVLLEDMDEEEWRRGAHDEENLDDDDMHI